MYLRRTRDSNVATRFQKMVSYFPPPNFHFCAWLRVLDSNQDTHLQRVVSYH